MPDRKIIHVIGTGTIGEPLIGLLSDYKDKIGIDQVTFHKNSALKGDYTKVLDLQNRGAHLAVDSDKIEDFRAFGMNPDFETEEAISRASVVIDCTPKGIGHDNKLKYYQKFSKQVKGFLAQGSEDGFGKKYARGINDSALSSDDKFIQIVSCNTHNISSIVDTLSFGDMFNIIKGDFTCIRRANDISQNGSFIASPEVGRHKDSIFGTHHARDSYDLFSTLHHHPNLFSSALKINSQYMHILRFCVEVKGSPSRKDILNKFNSNKFIALTKKDLTNKVFSFGRDHGYYGRIFNHTVIAENSLSLNSVEGNTKVTGFCFTPQDGNSILSSVAATLHAVHGKKYKDLMAVFDKFLLNYV